MKARANQINSSVQVERIGQMISMNVPRTREPLLKRPLDVVLSTVMIIFSAPFSLLIALAIKLEDGGPIFYQQERWGRGGTCFRAYKYRTMVAHSDKVFGIKQASENDARITRVGKFSVPWVSMSFPRFSIYSGGR